MLGFHFDPLQEDDIKWEEEFSSDDFDSSDQHEFAYGDSTTDGTTTEDMSTGKCIQKQKHLDAPLEFRVGFAISFFQMKRKKRKRKTKEKRRTSQRVRAKEGRTKRKSRMPTQIKTVRTSGKRIGLRFHCCIFTANPEGMEAEEEPLHCRDDAVLHPVEGRSIAAG